MVIRELDLSFGHEVMISSCQAAFRQFQLDRGPIEANRRCQSMVLTIMAKPHYAIMIYRKLAIVSS
jgi:hypothetical protein